MQQSTSTSPMDSFWALGGKEALQLLACTDKGLSAETAAERLKTYGPNELKGASHSPAVLLFLSQFKSPITLLLIGAALLSMGLGDITDAVIILIIILISSFLGFWQEKGAAHATEELLKMVQIRCRIVREGQEMSGRWRRWCRAISLFCRRVMSFPGTAWYWSPRSCS